MGGINDKIRQLRKKSGLKQSDLAKAIGLSNAAVGKIERGETENISIDTGIAIAEALQIPFMKLFEIKDYGPYDKSKSISEILNEENQAGIKSHKTEDYRNLLAYYLNNYLVAHLRKNDVMLQLIENTALENKKVLKARILTERLGLIIDIVGEVKGLFFDKTLSVNDFLTFYPFGEPLRGATVEEQIKNIPNRAFDDVDSNLPYDILQYLHYNNFNIRKIQFDLWDLVNNKK